MKVTIGKPIGNTQIYILNRYLKMVPIGVIGELCIAGDGVGAGYLNRPELTAEKFIDNPFGVGKMYRTGDLAYWRDDGRLAFVGRNDFQVKIRGLRIELGEIESAILAVSGISQCVVVVRKNTEGRQLICAFYTGAEIDAKELRNQIGKKLPQYMLPHAFVHLQEMPLTPSGKIDRKALPEVELQLTRTEYVAPKTERQILLCSVFAKTLGLDTVGIQDDFFDLGGDSLKAIELLCHAQDAGLTFELQDIFEHPTVESLSAKMGEAPADAVSLSEDQFAKYNPLLKLNAFEPVPAAQQALGPVFLTGATGFLGAHILDALLKAGCPKVYCLVRSDNARLYDHLRYYFGNDYSNDSRIAPITGDLSYLSELTLPCPISLVIHAAATVKHYGNYEEHHRINVLGTESAAAFAKRHGAQLIHISTTSVSGAAFPGIASASMENEKLFSEENLYIGQSLDNVYIRSKFFAECAVLDAALKGLPAKIIRVGNLTNRRSDGMFQPNYESNAFLNRIKAILELGAFPDYLMDLYAEFSPIDDTADAIVRIASGWPQKQTVFHIYNNRHLYFRDMLPMLQTLGHPVQIVSGEEFSKRLMIASDPIVRKALVNDLDKSGRWVLDSNIRVRCDASVELLARLGFCWREIDLAYLKQFLEHFRRIGYIQ